MLNFKITLKSSFFQVSALSMVNTATAVLGFMVSILAASWFGLGSELDCYYAAITIPTLLVSLLGVDYFGTNFFPVYSRVHKEKGRIEANNLANSVINSVLIAVLFCMCLLYLFAGFVHKLFLPGLDSQMLKNTVGLFRILFPIVLMQAPITFISYILQNESKVIISQISTLIGTATIFIFLIIFKNTLGVKSLIIGALTGTFLGLAFMIGNAKDYRFKPVIFFKDSSFRKVVLSSITMSGSGIIGRLTIFIERYFASLFPAGAISTLATANRLMSALSSFITNPLNTVMYVKMARAEARKDDQGILAVWQRYLLLAFMIVVPLGLLIIFLREDLVRFMFQRNNFTPEMANWLAVSLAGYAGILLFGGTGSMITRMYYLKNKVTVPATMNILGPAAFFIVLYTTTKLFGFFGISLGVSSWAIISGIILVIFIQKIFSFFDVAQFFYILLKIFISSLSACLIGVLVFKLTSLNGGILKMAVVSAVSIFIYSAVNWLFNRTLIMEMISIIKAQMFLDKKAI